MVMLKINKSLIFLFILLVSVSFVSAGFWDRFTGKVTDEACTSSDRAYRYGGNFYCDENERWLEQRKDGVGCINNYECLSYSCNNGVCGGVCPAVYDPVCGADGITYSNDCWAKLRGATIAYKGECVQREKCSDGSYSGRCSSNRPLYCDQNSKLFNKCSLCGCPAGEECQNDGSCKATPTELTGTQCLAVYDPVCGADGKTYSNDCEAKRAGVSVVKEGTCETKKCSDGTEYGKCVSASSTNIYSQPLFCEDGRLVDKCSVCGCPTGKICQLDGSCKEEIKKCSDGTPYGSCSANAPKYCENGNLIDRCSLCGCPAGQDCSDDGTCYVPLPQPPMPPQPTLPIKEGFEGDLSGWVVDYDLPPDAGKGGDVVDWEISISDKRAFSGRQSLRLYIDGRQDDGTVWIARKINIPKEAIGADLNFRFWSSFKGSINNLAYVVGYIGASQPQREEDFVRIAPVNEVGEWDMLSMSAEITGEVWVAVGFSVVFETHQTYFIDDVVIGTIGEPRSGIQAIQAVKCDYGCLVEDKCISIGIRINNQYCDLDKQLSYQKNEGESCVNNFECSDNLCLSGECTSKDFLKKIYEFLKTIFG